MRVQAVGNIENSKALYRSKGERLRVAPESDAFSKIRHTSVVCRIFRFLINYLVLGFQFLPHFFQKPLFLV